MAKQKEDDGSQTAYYKLGPKASMFWDENQDVNKKLLPGQVVALISTKKVEDFKISRGIIEVGEKEYNEYQSRVEKSQKTQSAVNTGNKDADDALKQAEAIRLQGQTLLDQANKAKAEAEALNKDATAKMEEANKIIATNPPKPKS